MYKICYKTSSWIANHIMHENDVNATVCSTVHHRNYKKTEKILNWLCFFEKNHCEKCYKRKDHWND